MILNEKGKLDLIISVHRRIQDIKLIIRDLYALGYTDDPDIEKLCSISKNLTDAQTIIIDLVPTKNDKEE